ncbi:MAG: hypothetical protein ABSB96_06970 [Gaiellaceae bacterium]
MRRISFSLVLLLACSLVLAACGSKSKSKNSSSSSNGSSSIPGAEIAPASAIGFVSISTDSSGAQWQQAKKLIARIPAAQKALDKALSGSGAMLSDFEQALGTTTVLVELGTAAKPVDVVLTNTTDAAKLKSLLAKDSSKKKPVTTEVGSWLAVADSQAALDQYQSAAAKGKLADSSIFKQALESVPADALVKAYLTGSAITATAGNLGSSSTSKLLGSAAKKNQLEWGTLAVSAVPEGFSVSGTFKGKSSLANSSSSLIGELPSATAIAVDLNGKALGLDKAVLSLRKNAKYGKQIPQIEAVLGVKLEDPAALAGSEMSIYGTSSGIGLLIKAPNAAQSKAMLDKAIKLLSAQLSGSSKSASVGGVKATELTLGKMKIYYGVKDGDLFVVTSANALPGAGKLSSGPVYAAAAKALSIPASNAGVLFIDFAQLAQLAKSGNSVVKSLGSLGGSSTTKTSSGFDPRGVSALLGYIAANGDKVELKALLSVK